MNRDLIIVLIAIALWLWFWAINDITRSRFKSPFLSTICLFSVIFFPVIGSILYLLIKRMITKEKRKFQPNFKKTNFKK